MEWREMLSALCQTTLLLLLSSVTPSYSEQCRCSDMLCISRAIEMHNSTASGDHTECCLWDFPPNLAVGFTSEFQKMGYAFGRATHEAPSFCISYLVPETSLELQSYFLVKLDLKGPDVCISEPGKSGNRSCSARLGTAPVNKADYCSGVPVSGLKVVNFSIDCLNCSEKYFADFQFRVYSEAFNTTQENWCDKIDRSIPSESYLDLVKQDKDQGKETRTDQETGSEEETTTSDGDNSAASRVVHILPVLTVLIMAVVIAVLMT